MNNQLDNTIALYPPDMSIDSLEEALSRLSHLSKERSKKAAIQVLNQLHLADRTESAQKKFFGIAKMTFGFFGKVSW